MAHRRRSRRPLKTLHTVSPPDVITPPALQASSSSSSSSDASDDESAHSEESDAPPASFCSFFLSELNPEHTHTEGEFAVHRQRVFNFVTLPLFLERFMMLGFLACLDQFLYMFTYVPCRLVFGALRFLLCGCCSRSRTKKPFLSSVAKEDLAQGLVIILCVAILNRLDMSRVYHYVRHQSVIKMYVLFNMLQIFDKMLCSFGRDILDALLGSVSVRGKGTPWSTAAVRFGFHFSVCSAYILLHALVLVVTVITLNVSVNSKNNSLMVVLVSNNFVELKSSVFKRFRPQNLFQVACSDVVERFQLFCFLLLIVVQHMTHTGLETAHEWLLDVIGICVTLYMAEIVVDWIKHGFMTKFNYLHPHVYTKFNRIVCRDILAKYHGHAPSGSGSLRIHSLSRRIGFSPLPLSCVLIRVVWKSLAKSPASTSLRAMLVVALFALLMSIKVFLSIVLLGHATKKLRAPPAASPLNVVDPTPEKRRPSSRGSSGGDKRAFATDAWGFVQVSEKELRDTERYALYGNRVMF